MYFEELINAAAIMNEIKTLIHNVTAKRVRVVLRCNERLYPILWVSMGEDGSIYLAPYMKGAHTIRSGSKPHVDGKAKINYADGQMIDETELASPKMSFHTSGVIHGFIKQSKRYRKSLKGISTPQYLCDVLFQHPTTFFEIDKPKNNKKTKDIIMNYNYREDHPIAAVVHASPEADIEPVVMKGASGQINIVLKYENLSNAKNLNVKIALYSSKGCWPPSTYTVFPASSEKL